jgi:hypothetical protein
MTLEEFEKMPYGIFANKRGAKRKVFAIMNGKIVMFHRVWGGKWATSFDSCTVAEFVKWADKRVGDS